MNNALLYFGGLLVVVFAALFAVPTFVDWNGYRGVFEEEASKVLGRDVRVGGSVNLRLLPAPYVRFEKVRLADTTGQTGEPFVRAESFTMWLSGPALLRGVLEASRVDLEKPVLSLALDGAGGGNWTTIELKSADLPFVPRDVALRSVNVNDGVIVIYSAASARIARIEAIDGELSADGIRGPFRFKGAAGWSGRTHDVKFATTTPSSDGSFRIKAGIKVEGTANSYVLDAAVEDFTSKPRLDGTLTAKLAVSGGESSGVTTAATIPRAEPVFEVTSQIKADASGAALEEINASLAEAAEPQIITGTAKAAWGAQERLDIALNSKWIDLDRMSGAGDDTAKFARVRRMVLGLMQTIVGDGAASAKIEIDQVKVGGETAGALKIDAVRLGSVLKLKELKAGLPGGSRLDIVGDFSDAEGKPAFAGQGFIRGTSLARLKAWAGKSGANIDITADGPFSAEGRIAFNENLFELQDASGEINGRPISGAVKVTSGGERRTIDVTIESARIDTREFFPGTAHAVEAELRRAVGVSASEPETDVAEQAPLGDVNLRLLAAELVSGGETFRNVDASMRFTNGAISIDGVRLVTSTGLGVGFDGGVKFVDGAPRGTLGFDITGATPEALGDLPRLLGMEAVIDGQRLSLLRDTKIAGLLKMGSRSADSFDVTLDGSARGSRVTGFIEFDQGLGDWRTSPARLQLAIDAPTLHALPAFAGVKAEGAGETAARPAKAVVTAVGAVGRDLALRANVNSDGFVANYEGRGSWPEGKSIQAQGTLDVKSRELADAMALAGLVPARGLSGVKVEGTIDIARFDTGWSLSAQRLAVGLSKVDASATVTLAKDAPTEFTADISADHVNLTGLIAALTDTSAAPAPAADDAATPAAERTLWPDGLLNLALFDGTKGEARVRFKALEVSGGVGASEGEMVVKIAPGSVKVADLKAKGAGGRVSADLALDKAPAGVDLNATLKLDDVQLTSLSRAAKGQGTLDVTAHARAQSPAGLIAVLTGTGKIALRDAVVPAPDASTAAGIADGVFAGKVPNDPQRVTAELAEAVAHASIGLGSREIPVQISDGSVKLESIKLESDAGHVSAATTVDLMSLGLTSSWFLTPVVKPLPQPEIPLPNWTPPAAKGALPPAVVAYSGRLDDLKGVETMVDAGEFQRELAVRQMERNVQELEQLRHMDEERARQERERRKALEQERAAAAAAAKAEREAARRQREQEALQPAVPDPNVPAQVPTPESQAAPQPAEAAAPGATPAPTNGTQQVITVEPIPGTEGASPTEAAPSPRPRPVQRTPQRPRTAGEEVMRSLGGFP